MAQQELHASGRTAHVADAHRDNDDRRLDQTVRGKALEPNGDDWGRMPQTERSTVEDRTYKLGSGTTSEYGRYVKSLGDPVTGSVN